MDVIHVSKRNTVYDAGDTIIKMYMNKKDYQDEKTVYQKLASKDYMAKLISYDDLKSTLTIEKLKNQLSYIDNIPVDFAKTCYEISKDLYYIGCSNVSDLSKIEHWFQDIKERDVTKLKVIDFDVVDIENHSKESIDYALIQLKVEYNFLFDRTDSVALYNFMRKLRFMGFSSLIVNEFEKNHTSF